MEAYFVLLPVALTSLALYVAATRGLGARREALRGALARVVECAGLAILLAAANLAVGFLLVLALRRLTGTFVSLYLNADGTLIGLAVLQAIAVQWWLRDGEEK